MPIDPGSVLLAIAVLGCGSKGKSFADGDAGSDDAGSCDPNDPFCDPDIEESGSEGAVAVNFMISEISCADAFTGDKHDNLG